jgi:hypothetical protein
MINRDDPLPITKQCHILELSRSSVYYIPAQLPDKDRELMRLIDEIHLEEPYLGSRGMKSALRIRDHKVGRIHVRTPSPIRGIRSTPTFCVGSTLSVPILYGVPISPTSPWHVDSVISSPLWTGQAGRCCLSDYRTH